jgi:class 3 adenylate cyclase
MGEPVTATVTLLFCDLVESTALASGIGDAAADALRRDTFDALRAEVVAHRGTEVKHLGDGLMVSFTSNNDAVRAACGMQQAIDVLARTRQLPLALRVGISVGEATFEDDDWFGTPVVEASRLCSAANSGQVLVADVVRVLLGSRSEVSLRPIGELALKGLPDPVAACEVEWAPLAVRSIQLPLPRAFSIAPRFSLAGRDAEYEQVTLAWKEAAAGARRAVLIAGEPGVGKTRLAAELGREVDREGGFVLLGRCDDGLGVPFQPFVEALAHVVGHAPDDQLAALLGPAGGELCRLVPELEQRLPGLRPTASDPETERYLLFEAIAGWLEAQSQIAPTLLVLDDLHWAAEPTLHMLRHVLSSERDLNLLVIGTYRDTEIDRTHPLGSLLAHLRRSEGVDRIALRGLDGDGVADLIERASGNELHEQSRELAVALHAETGGNPFFAIEVLVSLVERGAIYQDADGVWRSDMSVDEVGIPEGVKEVVGQRLSALPDACDTVLHGAAVAGQDFELDVIVAVTGDSEEQVIDALEAARVAGLLDELGGAPVRYRFSHALVQQTLLDEIPTARRLRFHRAIAEAIERLRADHLDRYRAALARHWYEAGTEPERALLATIAAADRALAQFADREALQWLAQAADLFDDAGAPDPTRIDVMTMSGEARRRIGDPSHREVLLEAGRLAERVGDGPRMATAALANGRGWQSDATGIDTERVGALEAAIAALGTADANKHALLLARLAVEKLYEPDRTQRVALIDEALEVARTENDPYTVALVIMSRHNVILSHETITERREENLELGRLADELGDPNLRFQTRAYGCFWRYQVGDLDGARVAAREAGEISRALAQPQFEWVATWEEAALTRLAGDLDASSELVERSHEIGTEAGIPDADFFRAVMRTGALADRADPRTLLEAQELCANMPPHYPSIRLTLATMEAAAGESDRARQTRDELGASPWAPWSEMGGAADSALAYAASFAGIEAALGEPSQWTRTVYEYMDPWRGQLFGNIIYAGPTEVYLAGIAPLAGYADELDGLIEAALGQCEEMSSPLLALYARLYGACALCVRNGAGDRDRAAAQLSAAIEIGDRIGAGIARAAAANFPALRDISL